MKHSGFRRKVAALAAAAMMCSIPAYAASSPAVQLQVDGRPISVPLYVNEAQRTMADISIAESLGMTCRTEGDQILFTRNGVTQIFTLGADRVGAYPMDTQAVSKDGTTYVPVRYLAEAFGLPLTWDGTSKVANIVTKQADPIDVTGVPAPSYDYSQANQLPMTGYFQKDLAVEMPDGTTAARTVKFYISEDACIRPYFTLITVPEGTDTTRFLKDSGWFALADENAEGLVVMEPGAGGRWGSFDEEVAYVNAAISFFKAPNADTPSLDTAATTGYFSSYGLNYFVGYGGNGAAALEAWAASNPGSMISQVYLDSPGLEQDVLDQAAALFYDGDEASGNLPLTIDESQRIFYDQLPVPTWLINCTGQASLEYWKHCSDCVPEAVPDATLGQVFAQSEDTDAWQSEFYGPISKVAVLDEPGFDAVSHTREIYDFLTSYTRYDNTCAFASQLGYRVRARELEEQGLLSHHVVTVAGEPREYLTYVPADSGEKFPEGSPVVFVWPGNTQSGILFLDATSWRTVADQEGFICVIPCEQYNAGSSVSVSHKNTVEFYQAIRTELKSSGLNIDWTRLYSTGQSAGSSATNTIASLHPEYFAAYASTSGPATVTDAVSAETSGIPVQDESALAGVPVPNYLLVGEGDMPTRTGSLFDEEMNQLDDWAAYFLKVNGGGTVNDYDSKETTGLHDRFTTYVWNNSQDVPLTQMTMSLLRNHNCLVQEMPMMWDYMKHFRVEWDEATGSVTRWYSPSAFAQDDGVEIT